jgi:PspA-Associated protein
VIVRIATEGQYELDDGHAAKLNELDNAAVDAVEAGNADTFRDVFGQMIELVRANGSAVNDDDIATSDVIIPPSDLSFEEAAEEFSGDGLIPG